jgi:hypothetical protein
MPRRRIIILIIGLILIVGALTPMLVFGQNEKDLSIKLSGMFGEAVSGLPEYIAKIYNYAIGLAVSLAIFMLMVGGFFWITAAGDRGKIEKAKGMMGDAVIGLILTVSAYLILNTINPAILSLKMPKIEKITGVPWEGEGEICATKPEDCPQGKTPINCQCVKPDELEVGAACIVGHEHFGDAYCATKCENCKCHGPGVESCLAKAGKIVALLTAAILTGGMALEFDAIPSLASLVSRAGGARGVSIKVLKSSGRLFFKLVPKTATGAAETAGVGIIGFQAYESCKQAPELCNMLKEGVEKEIGMEDVNRTAGKINFETQKAWQGVKGTIGHCYAEADRSVPNGSFCGKDEHCESGICVPLDPEAKKAAEEELKKAGGDPSKAKCGGILDTFGVCSSGEVGGSCWVEKDKDGKERIHGCKEGLKCVPSGGTWWGTGGVLMACSDGSEGSACRNNDDCQKGLKCENFGGGIKKCEKEGEGWQGAPCVDNGGCKEDKFPPKSYLAKAAGGNATVGCINVREGGLEDFIVNKFLEPTKYNKGKPGRCGRNGYEVGDPCFIPGTTTRGQTGGCNLFSGITLGGRSFICMIENDKSGRMRRYTEEDQRNGYWGKCCVYDEETGKYWCKVSSKSSK